MSASSALPRTVEFRRLLWKQRVPPLTLLLTGAAIAGFLALPLVYILVRGAQVGPETWEILLLTRFWPLLGTTLALSAVVTLGTIVLGLTLAFLVERTDLPGRNRFRTLLSLPLVIPPYVGAFCYLTVAGPQAWLERTVAELIGVPAVPALRVIGFPGAALVLTLFTYPLVYLLTAAALTSTNRNYEDAARSCGRNPWGVFFLVTLPLLKPALGAGALLVALYVLADIGAVTLLRVDTLTAAIYFHLEGRFDRAGASALSAVLALLALAILWGEQRWRSSGSAEQIRPHWRPGAPIRLGRWRWLALAFVVSVLGVALLLPLGVLTGWTLLSAREESEVLALLRPTLGTLLATAWKSAWSSTVAATLAVVLSLPVATLMARYRGPLATFLYHLAQLGYALPGLVVALGLVFVFHQWAPPVYGTVWMVIIAYLVRFLPEALQGITAAIAQVAVSLEEAARSLGRRGSRAMLEVTVPLIRPGVLAAWSLVFLSSLRELPATLLLRPAGFDTLAVTIWMSASEGIYTHAAPAALVLVLLSAGPLHLLLRQGRGGVPVD